MVDDTRTIQSDRGQRTVLLFGDDQATGNLRQTNKMSDSPNKHEP